MQGDIRQLRQKSRSHVVARPALKPVERSTANSYKPVGNGGVRSMEFVQTKSVPATKEITKSHVVYKTSSTPAVKSIAKPIAKPIVEPVYKSLAESVEQTVERPTSEINTSGQVPEATPEVAEVSSSRFGRFFAGHGLVYGAAVVVFFAGAGIVVQGLIVNQEVVNQVQVLSSSSDNPTGLTQSSDEVPSEEKPPANAVDTYRVAADMPRTISLPSLDVKARVLQVGVDDNNQLLAPKNVFDAAWYTGSSKPGEAGAAVIDGHYSGVSTKGVFGQIKKLKNGDKIDIERGDGKVLSFTIRQVETVAADAVDMGKLLVSVETSLPGLNLITCGGKFDASTHKFSDRTVVYAVLE